MNVLIVEDETSAYENLREILAEISSDIDIVGNTESVARTVSWLNSNPRPDLIFMDIHLSDDSAFAIFDRVEIDTPIIFTTAFDQYAIDAFKVNSIDYLLKPIKTCAVEQAIEKFKRLNYADIAQYLSRITKLVPVKKYKDKLLIPFKDKLLPVNMAEVAFFYTSEKNTLIYLKNGNHYAYAKTLEQIMDILNPDDFFRANKQFIVQRESVTNITIWFDSRLLLTLDVDVPERIYVSKNKAAEFKSWITQ